ncbi:MAG: hypothetical protein LCH63_18700 [Candidatus Melainabacteria bacterium]|jgi:hypothetical protein|nr:hypothetical protein [Candidatus Melainabacteria bacterium]OPZ87339.1 MAG: hypothetical protein BWY75_01907 [bacterium ADurb.Bin425]
MSVRLVSVLSLMVAVPVSLATQFQVSAEAAPAGKAIGKSKSQEAPVAKSADAVTGQAGKTAAQPAAQSAGQTACDLVPVAGAFNVRPDGTVYLKKASKFPFQNDTQQFVPEVVVSDKTSAKVALHEVTGKLQQDGLVAKYKQINNELPGSHSHRSGLAGLNRNWQ